jgi:hypothetical protein
MTEFVEEAFTNEFGQVIQPGENVLFAATSWKQTSIRKGQFKGVRYGDVFKTEYLKDSKGNYIQEEKKNWNGTKYFVNKSETNKYREVVAVVIEKVNRGKVYKWVDLPNGKRDYIKTDEDVFGTSILPLKRVYKLSTSLENMAGMKF